VRDALSRAFPRCLPLAAVEDRLRAPYNERAGYTIGRSDHLTPPIRIPFALHALSLRRPSLPGVSMPDKRNILLIMADQLTPLLMGAYGHPVVKTPNIDGLVQRGVRFDAAYSPCPLCAPARACLMTGKYISHNKVWDNASPLGSDEPTMCHYLTQAGYDTVASGKLHYIGPDQLHGFGRRLTTDIYPAGMNMLPTNRRRPPDRLIDHRSHANGYRTPRVGVGTWSQFLAYDTETQFRAQEYLYARAMGNDAHSDDPFFLMVSFHCPHDPFIVPQHLWDIYRGEPIEIPEYPDNMADTYSVMDRWLNAYHGTDRIDIRSEESLTALRRAYYALVTFIDNQVGALLECLQRTGIADDTVVLFTSDHGDMLAAKNMVQKRSFYEQSARVPLIVQFPDGLGAGTRCGQPVSLVDIAPTFLEIAGVERWLPMDGSSLMPCIEGSSESRIAFSESHTNGVYAPCLMAREGQYKYILVHNEAEQLFDLESDPGEWHNLATVPEFAEVKRELRQQILAQFDPDAIEAELQQSLDKRHLIKPATEANETHWDFQPVFDASKQYCR